MSTTAGPDARPHVVAAFSARLHEVLDGLLEAPVWSMSAAEQRTVLVELSRAESRICQLRLRVVAAADRADAVADTGATSTAAWLAHRTRQLRSSAHADVRLARLLDDTYAATRDAWARGLVDAGQARVIVAAVGRLPGSASATVRERAEKHLIELAAHHDEKALKVLGRRVFEVVDPRAADAEDGRRLAVEEASAARATSLHLFDTGDGTHTGRFTIASLHALMLTKMLHALVALPHPAPAKTGPGAPAVPREPPGSRPEQLGQAFGELLERMPADRLPRSGGVSATVVALLDYATLLSGTGAAKLDTGELISASLARRLACQAGVIPTVYQRLLGGRSVVLDMGRRSRFHTEHQRIALDLEQGGCTADGCDRPAGWCQVDLPGFHGQILDCAA
jgi:hypothetical protein